jgi:hypothetical protein
MAMETIDKIISFAGAIVERFPAQSPMDATAFSEMIIVSILLSAAPTRIVVVFGAILLGLLILLAPNAIILFAIGCGLTALSASVSNASVSSGAETARRAEALCSWLRVGRQYRAQSLTKLAGFLGTQYRRTKDAIHSS